MTDHLKLEPRIADPDGFYEKLIDLHQGLSSEESNRVNAKLILLLANHVGETEVLESVLQKVREEKV